MAVPDDFGEFYLSEYRRVFRTVSALGASHEDAWDITQEAFARALARWSRLRRKPWRGGWVMTTAMNLSKKTRREIPRGEIERGPAVEVQPAERVDLVRALRQVSERQREAAVLYYVFDLSVPDVAQAMGVSEGAVKTHLSRARGFLHDALKVSDD